MVFVLWDRKVKRRPKTVFSLYLDCEIFTQFSANGFGRGIGFHFGWPRFRRCEMAVYMLRIVAVIPCPILAIPDVCISFLRLHLACLHAVFEPKCDSSRGIITLFLFLCHSMPIPVVWHFIFSGSKHMALKFGLNPAVLAEPSQKKIFIRACVEIYVDHTSDGRAGRPSEKGSFSIPHNSRRTTILFQRDRNCTALHW